MKKIKKKYSRYYLDYKPTLKKPTIPIIMTLAVFIIGTIGYDIIWQGTGATIVDCIYMTMITITTLGFSEIYPMDSAGRIFTMFIAIFGIASLFYVFGVIMENIFIIQLSNYRSMKKMVKKIDSLNNHIIVVGYGRVGQLAVSELKKAKVDFVVIDDDFKEFDVIQSKDDILKVFGDATEDETLIKAGITKAQGMIVATGNPATNVFVVLSAKVLNPSIFIVARVEDEISAPKLIKAGADRTVNPYYIGGQRLANLIINPNIVDFFETNFHIGANSLTIESIKLEEGSPYNNKSIKELEIRRKTGATIIAIVRGDTSFTVPDADFILKSGDEVLFMGTREQIQNIQSI